MKKYLVIVGIFAFLVLSTFVYAWAFDTDGGDLASVKGTCTDEYGNHTDFCSSKKVLTEFYPLNVGNNTVCASKTYNCNCRSGRCAK